MSSFHTALQSGHPVSLPQLTGVATSLGARQVCQRAFDLTREREIISLTVSDIHAVNACLAFLDDHRTLVEPACGATLAALYESQIDGSKFDNVLVVVCGGSTATNASLQGFKG